jgi:hypothetical protein
MTEIINISKSTVKKYSVFISSFSPSKQTMCEKCGFFSSLSIKVGVKKERTKKRGKKGKTVYYSISHYTCVCSTKIL